MTETTPDVRVFNLSFDTEPLSQLSETKKSEHLALVQDLDNFIFQSDTLVVVSAGNSPPGVAPTSPYPEHYAEPQWQLGAWARGFNVLTCGAIAKRLHPGGLATQAGWPSPFSRVGPGLADSPKPDFVANGGNSLPNWGYEPGMGVWGLSAAGNWEDLPGTSFAAPLLAREAAFALEILKGYCEQGTRPYAVTAKCLLALLAPESNHHGIPKEIVERALGRGEASVERLRSPDAATAVLAWQGLLSGPEDVARIQIPVPLAWYRRASLPQMRLIVCWDPPVNAAVRGVWATRAVAAHLKASPDARSQRGTHGTGSPYPWIDRTYDLKKLPGNAPPPSQDEWLLELSYREIAPYYVGMEFPPEQRIAFAAELRDAGEPTSSPQYFIQELPLAPTLNRLSIPNVPAVTPIVVRPLR